MGLLGAAAILLAAAWSDGLLVPVLTPNSVPGRVCLGVGAFGLILLFAFKSHRHLQRAQAEEATAAERRRLVCDLHDGMAQDLAFIATYAERLVPDLGPENPLTVAARRALAASRGCYRRPIRIRCAERSRSPESGGRMNSPFVTMSASQWRLTEKTSPPARARP